MNSSQKLKRLSALGTWVWRMAWRDSRRSRGRLLVFASALTLGVAALVAIDSVGWNLERAIREQARSLVGADLAIETLDAPGAEARAFIESLGGERAYETRLASMATFPRTGASRLVQVRAMEGGFPFYGRLETEPASASADFARGRGALAEESLLLQYGLHAGDSLQIGGKKWPILGFIKKLPGEANAFASIAPRVLIPRGELPGELLGHGALVRHITYLKLPPAADAERLVAEHTAQWRRFHLETDTVAHRQRELGRTFENVTRFLNLVSFTALLLGGIGVASSIHAHLRQKLRTVAILRCLGASAAQTVVIYLIQALALGLAGAISGAAVGIAVQSLAPGFLGDALPVELTFAISWGAVAKGITTGFLTCALFVLLPLVPLRHTPPLMALRSAFESAPAGGKRRDLLPWLLYAILAVALVTLPWLESRDARLGLGFSGGLAVAFALLALTARGMTAGARRFSPRSWPFEWRQGIANLYRPNNRTFVMVFTLGLSTFLLLEAQLTRDAMLHQFAVKEGSASQPNLVFFDIQSDQKDPLAALVRSKRLPVMGIVPVVTMRLTAIRGKSVDDLLSDKPAPGKRPIPGWRLRHEYRSTYRPVLNGAETISAGQWTPRVSPADSAKPAPVSVEAEMASEMHLNVGDALTFDIQGVPVETRVGSIRKVDWSRFEPNFFVVFPVGVLEDAPALNILVTRTPDAAASADIQGAVVHQFPGVSAIDLSLLVATIRNIVDKAALGIRVLSIFTVGSGLLVVAAAILTGRYERVQEGVLLRTLGASRRQIFRILAVEYFCLGSLAALTGIVLAVAASWALAVFIFQTPWAPSILPIAASWAIASGLTVTIGLLASRGVCDQPPLAVLRAEA
jgi:putative ABC transport system permease protein